NDKNKTKLSTKAPAELDLAALAKSHNVADKETVLLSKTEVEQETDLGKSYNMVRDERSMFGFRRIGFAPIGFSESLQLYRPSRTFDDDRNGYVFWKVEDAPEEVPPFEKVRSQVDRAWRVV